MALAIEPFVRRLSSRSILNSEEQAALRRLPVQPATVRGGYDVVGADVISTSSCLVVSGLLARFHTNREGARQLSALYIPGDMPDLHSLVRPLGIGGVTALSDSTILRVPHLALRRVILAYPAIAEALWRDSAADAAVMCQGMISLGQRSAKGRLAHIFCEMAIRYSKDRTPLMNYVFPVTQLQLGELIGLTGVHVNRTMMAFRKTKVLDAARGTVAIHDWDALARIGDFNPAYLIADLLTDHRPLPNAA